MNSPPVHPAQDMALRFHNVSFSYAKEKVFENVSFHIHQGEFVVLTGPNGSGKTTALKLVLGLEAPQAGSIEFFGQDFNKRNHSQLHRHASLRLREGIGYVPQQADQDRAFPITVREVVKMGRLRPLSRSFGMSDNAAVEQALEQAEIAELASHPYNALSGGQRRRVLVARALASLDGQGQTPGFLILDEPTANMDEESEMRLFATLGKLKGGITILIVTHDRDFVSSLVDRVLCMAKGGHCSESANGYSIVQHSLEPGTENSHDDSGIVNSRILHKESFPGDNCYGGEGEKTGGGQGSE